MRRVSSFLRPRQRGRGRGLSTPRPCRSDKLFHFSQHMATTHTNSHSFSSSEHSSSQCTSTVHSPLRGQLRSTSSTSSTQCRETRDIAHPDGWPDTSATVVTETKAERNGSLRPPGVARYKSEHDSGMYQDGLWTTTEHHACPAGSGSIQPVPSVSLSFVTTDDPNHPVRCRTSVGSPPSGTLDDSPMAA